MIRFAILAGASTDAQVQDKDTIPAQIETCRRAIAQLGAKEVACYVIDGYSRTGYDSLADAMHDIPPLGEAIEAAADNLYDVLILDNFDRLGDLAQLLATRFKRYKKQIYSARQSGRVHDPTTYDPYDDESTDIDMHVEGIIQTYRLNKLRRGYKLGNRARAERGLYSLRWPVGYLNDGKDNLTLHPLYARLFISLKDKLFEGYSVRQLEEYARSTGIQTPNGKPWAAGSIYKILVNPFYAGMTAFGKRKLVNGKPVPNPNVQYYQGKHEPLWTWEDHLRILDTFARRHQHNPRTHVKSFSGILYCSECKHLLWHREGVWRCHPPGHDHISMSVQEANYTIGRELAKALRDYEDTDTAAPTVGVEAAVSELDRQITRVQKGYDAGIYTLDQAKDRIDAIKVQIAHLEDEEIQRKQKAIQKARLMESRDKLLPMLDSLPDMFMNHEPRANNLMLREILRKIIIHPDRKMDFIWL